MALPPELIEKILSHCDGKTLTTARYVSKEWASIVDYLGQKTSIWKWCCHEEIPSQELIQYLEQFTHTNDHIPWISIYKNWLTWQTMSVIRLEVSLSLSPSEIPRITCIDVYDKYTAVGSEDGRVRIFDQYWKLLCMTRHQAEKVLKVNFLAGWKNLELKIVIAYPKTLIIDDLFANGGHVIIEDVRAHSVYKDHIAYERDRGRITIEKLRVFDEDTNRAAKFLEEIWFGRIYSTSHIACFKLWNGMCTMLVKNDVRKIQYQRRSLMSPMKLPEKCHIVFSSLPNPVNSQQIHYILRDDLIISLNRAERVTDKEYMEVIMLQGGSNYVKKLFNTSDVLGAAITCVCLYGNTLVLGVDSGIVYFYHVPSWKHFCIKQYQMKIIVGKHPITNVVVRETKTQRKFFVASSFDIHEIQ